jgi:hypothetical protein
MSTKTREVIWDGRIMAQSCVPKLPAKRLGRPPAPLIEPMPKQGPSAWKDMAGQRSQAQLSANA